jgi:hypothetical protein
MDETSQGVGGQQTQKPKNQKYDANRHQKVHDFLLGAELSIDSLSSGRNVVGRIDEASRE